jgi:hypothetical protein
VIAAATGLVLSPLASDRDGFPLSRYPMFAEKRGAITVLEEVVGVRGDGSELTLGPKFLGTREVLQARAHLERAVRAGAGPAEALCAEIAERARAEPRLGVDRVEIRTVRHDAFAYFRDPAHEPLARQVRARCLVHPSGA